MPGPINVLPHEQFNYRAGVDLSGGRKDSAALVIVHKEDDRIIQDLVREWKAPFNPYLVVADMARELKRWGLLTLQGDNYAGEWPVAAFRQEGIRYKLADRSKNHLYRELLPVLCGGKESIELLDCLVQTNQLASLERRTRSGGDVIDHPNNGHDDLANALAVAVDSVGAKKRRIGALDLGKPGSREIGVYSHFG